MRFFVRRRPTPWLVSLTYLQGVHGELELAMHAGHELELDIAAFVIAEGNERPAVSVADTWRMRAKGWGGWCGWVCMHRGGGGTIMKQYAWLNSKHTHTHTHTTHLGWRGWAL